MTDYEKAKELGLEGAENRGPSNSGKVVDQGV
jgi:hypothetical protein